MPRIIEGKEMNLIGDRLRVLRKKHHLSSFPNVWKHRLFISAAVPFQELRTKVEPSLTLN